MQDKPLSRKQKQFCEEYIKDYIATKAAIRAGYSQDYDTAAVQANRLLKNDKINDYIEKLIEKK